VIYRIDRVIEVREDWPLILGDAIQNFRAALDYLMYQFAIVYLGRVPTVAEAKNIQFPEIRKLKQIPGHRFLQYIRPVDLDQMKLFQPYRRRHRRKKLEFHPLPWLIRMSNIDKHRRLHVIVVAPYQASFTNRPDGYRDCVPLIRTDPATGRRHGVTFHKAPSRPLRANTEILRVFVRPTGPNPDVEVDARLTGWITVGKTGPIIPLLDGFGEYVAAVLNRFQPRR